MENNDALLILCRARLPGATLRELLARHAEPRHALEAARHGGVPGLPGPTLAALRRPDPRRLDGDRAWLQRPGRRLLGWHEADYPALLRRSPGPPPILFLEGDADLAWHPQIAVVGSRRPSPGGIERTAMFSRAFARAGFVVTSGLADGVDAAAHDSALASGRTLAVVGTGLDTCYPARNRGLAERIAGAGLVGQRAGDR